MNKILARRLKKYYKQINSAIPKDYPNKNQIFNSIKSDIAAYLTDNPEISIEHIESHFGTLTEVACSFIESLSTSQVLSSIRQKRKKMLSFWQFRPSSSVSL